MSKANRDITPWILAIWIHLFNLGPMILGEISTASLQLMVLFSIPIFLYLELKFNKKNKIDVELSISILVLIGWILISFIFNFEMRVLIRVVNLIYCLLFFWSYITRIESPVQKLFKSYAYIGFFVLLTILYQTISLDFRNDYILQPNYYGLMIVSICVCSICLENRWYKILIYVLSFYVLFHISSRTSFLCFIVIFSYDAFIHSKFAFLNCKSYHLKLMLICFYLT